MKKGMIALCCLAWGLGLRAQVDTVCLSVDSCRALVLSGNKELRMEGMKQQAVGYERKAARTKYLPRVPNTCPRWRSRGGWMGSNPSVFNSFERNFKGMWNVGVAVNIPLLTWGERSHKVKAARAEACMARYQLEETREKVELQVTQNRQKLHEAQERLGVATRSLDEADENLRYATLGMQEGVIPVSHVLEAQTAWLAAHSECVSARIDLRMARLYLQKSLGQIR